jgi:hypothetical protein
MEAILEDIALKTKHSVFTCNCISLEGIILLSKADLLLRVRRLEALPRMTTYLNRPIAKFEGSQSRI